MNRAAIWLSFLSECLDRIEDYTRGGEAEFLASPLHQDAVIRRLQIIADTVERLPDFLLEQHREAGFRALNGLRNILVHEPLNTDVQSLWTAVSEDLPRLRQAFAEMERQITG